MCFMVSDDSRYARSCHSAVTLHCRSAEQCVLWGVLHERAVSWTVGLRLCGQLLCTILSVSLSQ